MELPRLFARDSKQRIKEWSIRITKDGYTTESGLLNGRLTPTTTFCVAKRNRTLQEQIENEAIARWKKQQKKGYRESIKESDEAPKRPALCQDYKDNSHKFRYPARTGPKLNGMRVLAIRNGTTYEGLSRELNEVLMPAHILKALDGMPMLPDIIDGEFYVHGMHLQDIVSLVKRPLDKAGYLRSAVRKIQFRLFDLPHATMTAEERMVRLMQFDRMYETFDYSPVQFVPAIPIESEEAMYKWHRKFVEAGYEGSVIRSCDAHYGYGLKAAGMMKVKDFQDAEFEIVGIEPDKNGLAIAVCVTEKGIQFKANFEGSAEFETNTDYKRHIIANQSKFIGYKATVRFQDFSKDGVPTIGNNISAIRNYE